MAVKNPEINSFSIDTSSLEYDIIFGEGISKITEAINIGLASGIIHKEGISLYFNKEKLGRSMQTTKKYLKEHSETLNKIIKDINNT